jgi:hypothetical protein
MKSGEGYLGSRRNPETRVRSGNPWIPACAGMTAGEARKKSALAGRQRPSRQGSGVSGCGLAGKEMHAYNQNFRITEIRHA